MEGPRFSPRIVELPAREVLALRYEGDPASPALIEAWRRFHDLRASLTSAEAGVLAIAYAPPVAYGAQFAVDLGVPVDASSQDDPPAGLERRVVPGGRFSLATGPIDDLAEIYRAARTFANGQGLAVERGGIEVYRAGAGRDAPPVVDAGFRIHD